jgi:hypothetical protein
MNIDRFLEGMCHLLGLGASLSILVWLATSAGFGGYLAFMIGAIHVALVIAWFLDI